MVVLAAALVHHCGDVHRAVSDDGAQGVSGQNGLPVESALTVYRTGDPTELALLAHAERLRLFAFDPVRRRMGTVDRFDGQVFVHVKGAPEEVLPRCTGLDDAHRAAALAVVDQMAGRGLRVLAVARRGWTAIQLPERDDAESELTLVGLVGLIDPPRPEVAAAVAACHLVGIRIHVVTGDNGRTATEIARSVGIGADQVVDGPALDAMPDDELGVLLRSGAEVVFAGVAFEVAFTAAVIYLQLSTAGSDGTDGKCPIPAVGARPYCR